MRRYSSLIEQNTAPKNVKHIGVYNSSGVKIGEVKVGKLALPDVGEKLYSFGAVSDIHLQAETAQADFQKALTFFNEVENVDFICICGDLSNSGIVAEHTPYTTIVNTYSPNTPVYECTGNHDVVSAEGGTIGSLTGNPLYYTFEQGNDLFIMFGMYTQTGDIFTTEQLQWLYEILEANRNKRCFVFQHCLRWDGSGKPYQGSPTGNLLNCDKGKVFASLMEHYKNVIWFHGHSHMDFDSQEDCSYANYDRMYGCHSIHIPSLALPRDYQDSAYVNVYAESEGYVVDVYENHIVLRGRDFVSEKFLPIATYCIDTTPQTIEANTFTDSTGVITTGSTPYTYYGSSPYPLGLASV